MKLFIAMDNFCNDGLLMSVSQEGGFRCDTVITKFIPTNINYCLFDIGTVLYLCLNLQFITFIVINR